MSTGRGFDARSRVLTQHVTLRLRRETGAEGRAVDTTLEEAEAIVLEKRSKDRRQKKRELKQI